MKQDYTQFKNFQFKELPAPLPVGERVIWQGKPSFKGLALRSFHIREVAIYFGLLLAWLFRRAACYTITSKRVLFQFGVALPMTMNIPLSKIANAALKTYRDGSGDIPLKLNDDKRVSYLLLWPHIRPWRLRVSEPMLNSVPDAAQVAARLAEALTGKPDPSAVSLMQFGDAEAVSNAIGNSPATVAA